MTRSSRTPVPPVPSTDGNGSKLPAKPDPRRLHEATDRLNKVLLDFEDVLVQLKLGV